MLRQAQHDNFFIKATSIIHMSSIICIDFLFLS